MLQIKKEQPNNGNKRTPTEAELKVLLDNGMEEAVKQILELNPELKFKVVDGRLEDLITGAALWLKRFITQDKECLEMKQDALKLAKVSDEVLITGETGTGKEIIARAMLGDREGQFIRINCAALPEGLIESELFGIKEGSATGVSKKQGMIKAADGGVMFLDEIGDLPLITQSKLLNALQPIDGKRYIRPVGSTEEVEITCRFVCATHRNLKEMVKENKFRQDLYARISTFELVIPPLRERLGDVEPIVIALGEILKMPVSAKEFLVKYGEAIVNSEIDLSLNVRSLERALKRYNILGKV